MVSVKSIQVQIVIDLVCPWCFVGKRRLDKAVEIYNQKHVENPISLAIQWLPYQLMPNAPEESIEKSLSYAQRFGAERSKEMHRHMIELGKGEGIAFDYGGKIGNTLKGHQLIQYSHQFNKQNEVVEKLFKSYFEEKKDITKTKVLGEIATEVGLDKAEALKYIATEESEDAVKKLLRMNGAKGISGVPNFTFEKKWSISGGQSTQRFLDLLNSLNE